MSVLFCISTCHYIQNLYSLFLRVGAIAEDLVLAARLSICECDQATVKLMIAYSALFPNELVPTVQRV